MVDLGIFRKRRGKLLGDLAAKLAGHRNLPYRSSPAPAIG